MNPDLMITIAFSLWALLVGGVWVVLFVRSVRTDKTSEMRSWPYTDPGPRRPLKEEMKSTGR
jgi:hypothetical protein